MLQSNRHDLLGDLPLLNSRGRQRPAAETFLVPLNPRFRFDPEVVSNRCLTFQTVTV